MKAIAQGCEDFRRARPNRREALRAGGLALTGLSLPALFQARAQAQSQTPNPPRRARACILIFQWGGPSHLDTWDPKPDAPSEIKGPFQAIETKTPGLRLGEHFPLLAQQTHRLAVIHSMTHDDAAHLSTAHRILTGHMAPTPKSDAAGPSPQDSPQLGSLVSKLHPSTGPIPRSVIMPWIVAHPAAPGGRAPGQNGGWLGQAHSPFLVDGDPNAPNFRVRGLDLPEGVSLDRLSRRRTLLGNLPALLDLPGTPQDAWDSFQHRALDTLSSAEARGAFDIEREDPRLRDRYGRHIHGQCLLLARRLVESGVELVTVNWHNDGSNFWDTHGNNFNKLKTHLMPPADQGFSALLDDLADRGLLDETLVVWVGEFGRTPRINAANAGREHWPRCFSAALGGGGIQGGQVYGASDHWAAYPSSDPVSPEDLGATILSALGIAPDTMLDDPFGRPLQINNGQPLTSLFT